MKRVLLLNPPGKKIYIRDYYCSKVSKAYYLPQPVDLLMQSAHFPKDEYELNVVDAIAEQIDQTETLKRCEAYDPHLVVSQCGSVSLPEDVAFFEALKARLPEVPILCSGDAFLDDHVEQFRLYPWLDGIITNFFNDGPRWFLEQQWDRIHGLVYRTMDGCIEAPQDREKLVDMSVPRHDLFRNALYRMPFADAFPMATVLTNYACPFPCTFCIMSTMPFISRTAASIIEELKALKQQGIRYIYFSDQTFYLSKSITEEVLDFMIEENLGIHWMCFSRVDVLDREKLLKMKQAGCNLIMFGVEWAEDHYLEQYKKNYTLDQIKETFRLSKELGIKRLGTFLLGVPGQDEESIRNTVRFAKEIDADYASFNIAVPRSNTSFRTEALEAGLIDEDLKVMDQSGDEITIGTGKVSKERLQQLRQRAYIGFYFRPAYLWKRIHGIRTRQEFITHVREAWFILRGML